MAWANVCRSSNLNSHQPPAAAVPAPAAPVPAAAAAAAASVVVAGSNQAIRNKPLPMQLLQQPLEAQQALPVTGSSYYTWISSGFPGHNSQWTGSTPLSSSKQSIYSSAGPPTPLQQSPAVRPIPCQQLQRPSAAAAAAAAAGIDVACSLTLQLQRSSTLPPLK
jgi:hypothetical protein